MALYIGGVAVDATAAELNIMDGVTSTAAELNALDGFTGDLIDLKATHYGFTSTVAGGGNNWIETGTTLPNTTDSSGEFAAYLIGSQGYSSSNKYAMGDCAIAYATIGYHSSGSNPNDVRAAYFALYGGSNIIGIVHEDNEANFNGERGTIIIQNNHGADTRKYKYWAYRLYWDA